MTCLSHTNGSFSIHSTPHCPLQCPSCTPCRERKARQFEQILFFSWSYDSITHARRARLADWCWLTFRECVTCHLSHSEVASLGIGQPNNQTSSHSLNPSVNLQRSLSVNLWQSATRPTRANESQIQGFSSVLWLSRWSADVTWPCMVS